MKTKQIVIGVAATVAAGLILHRLTRGGGFIGPPQPAAYGNEGDNLVFAGAPRVSNNLSTGKKKNGIRLPVMKTIQGGLA